MIKSVFHAAMLILVSGISWAGDMTQTDAFNQGAAFGRAYAPPVINSTTAIDHLPTDYFGATPTATQGLDATTLYGGGIGDLLTPGVAKNSDCMAMVGNPDYKQQIPCDAVKTMNKSDKGGFVFSKNDPMFAKSKAARSDPLGVLGAAGMKFDVTERACTAGTNALPTETVVRSCSEIVSTVNSVCQPYQDVAIDHFSNFKCKQSPNPLEQQSCNKTMDVAVNVTRCTPGDLLYTTSHTHTNGRVQIQYLNLYCGGTPNTINVVARLDRWCYPGYSDYDHTARIIVSESGVSSIDAYGNKAYQEQSYCFDNGNTCSQVTTCTGPTCPPLVCHPHPHCTNWKSGPRSNLAYGDPVSQYDQTKMMFSSRYRRGCGVALDGGTCDPATGNCSFNFKFMSEYNNDDSIYPDVIHSFQANNIWAMKKVTGVPTWINQCTALEARVQ